MEFCSPPFVVFKTSITATTGWSSTFQPMSPNLNVDGGQLIASNPIASQVTPTNSRRFRSTIPLPQHTINNPRPTTKNLNQV